MIYPNTKKIALQTMHPQQESVQKFYSKYSYGPSLIVEEDSDIVNSPGFPEGKKQKLRMTSASPIEMIKLSSSHSISLQSSPDVQNLNIDRSDELGSLRIPNHSSMEKSVRPISETVGKTIKHANSISEFPLENKLSSAN